MGANISKKVARIEKRYRDFSKRFADVIWVIDANTLEILFISDSTKGLCGYSAEEVIGNHIKKVVTGDSYQNTITILEKARLEHEEGKDPSFRLEVKCYHKNGTTTWVEITAKFVKGKGEPLQIVGISRDIMDMKLDEMKKDHLLKMFKEALTEQKQLMSKIELYEKLLPICGGCRRIRDDKNNWWPLEEYAQQRTDCRFTHTICRDCKEILYPDMPAKGCEEGSQE